MVVDSPQTGGNSQNNCDFELIHNYVTNRNVNISQTVTKQIVISSKKSHCFGVNFFQQGGSRNTA